MVKKTNDTNSATRYPEKKNNPKQCESSGIIAMHIIIYFHYASHNWCLHEQYKHWLLLLLLLSGCFSSNILMHDTVCTARSLLLCHPHSALFHPNFFLRRRQCLQNASHLYAHRVIMQKMFTIHHRQYKQHKMWSNYSFANGQFLYAISCTIHRNISPEFTSTARIEQNKNEQQAFV